MHRPVQAARPPIFKKSLISSGVITLLAVLAGTAQASSADDKKLAFDASTYTSLTVTIDGVSTPVRWYKEICYVANPVASAAEQAANFGSGTTTISNTACGYQSMNVFVPEASLSDQSTAIYLGVNNAGWMKSYITASVSDGASFDSSSSQVGAALKAGYVYIDVATRGRTLVGADGSYTGKAPSEVVDAKAAIRYLRLNDATMPGSAERIVVNGTSGGGGLASIVGASGNAKTYWPYLQEIGAAGLNKNGKSTLKDNAFAIVAYCPITELGHADMAYEWLYNVNNTRHKVGSNPLPGLAKLIAADYPDYLAGLGLSTSQGDSLTVDTMLQELKYQLKVSANAYLAASSSNSIPALGESFSHTSTGPGGSSTVTYVNDWIDVDSSTRQVKSINVNRYLVYVATLTTLKGTPAFDGAGLSTSTKTGETNLFGPASQSYQNFTKYGWNRNDTSGDNSGRDDTGLSFAQYAKSSGAVVGTQLKLIDPMPHLLGQSTTVTPNWYVRHGSRDRDTAFTVPLNLNRALASNSQVQNLNFRLAWGQPHSGNYDVSEAMTWLSGVLSAAGTP